MQITGGMGPVGGEISPPQVPPPEGGLPPVAPEVPAPPAGGVEIPVGTQLPETPAVLEPDPVAEAAALEQARAGVGAGTGTPPAPVAEGVATPGAPIAPGNPVISSALTTETTAAPTDRQAVHDILTSDNTAAAGAALEGNVAGNPSELPVAEDGDIAGVAAADEATVQLGPEPVPAPPEAAVPVTPETPDSLVAAEQVIQPAEPIAEPAPLATPVPQGPPVAPPPSSFINTTGDPLPPASGAPAIPPAPPPVESASTLSTEVSQAAPPPDLAEPDQEDEGQITDSAAARRLVNSMDGDFYKLKQFFESLPGSDDGETKTGEGQQ